MANIQITLDQPIDTDFTVFSDDQVLTAEQLNGVSNYFDDQTRLTRVKLLGVGVVCGLRPSLQSGSIVNVTKGAGVTTDGDLLYFAADTAFDRYKPYDQTKPQYSFFYSGQTMLPVFELVSQPDETKDPTIVSLKQFNTTTGKSLADMVAVLFMESYVSNSDLCSGTDCDNLGSDCVNNIKLLLVEKSTAALLKSSLVVPDDVAGGLNEIVADRVPISSAISSTTQLTTAYGNTCNAIYAKLTAELPKLYPKCSSFLADVFSSDPSSQWLTRLQSIKAKFPKNGNGIQYYYDFLKDVVETYNQFIELLFNERTLCCPPVDAFPKHLLLGDLTPPATAPDENRMAFYPSPAVSCCEKLKHAKFLAVKIDTLIRTFQIPETSKIRITPSYLEDQPLEERAIPYYYKVTGSAPVQSSWNFRLHQQGRDVWNYSYNASLYGAKGGAANPFGSQIGRFSFFRIEGHLGQNISAALSAIQSQIQSNNLPIAVRSIYLSGDLNGFVRDPGYWYTPLHDIHYLFRQGLYYQLGDVVQFSGNFKEQVNNAITNKIISDSAGDNGISVTTAAAQNDATIENKGPTVQKRMMMKYSDYSADPSWKNDLGTTMQAAGQYKSNLGNVINTNYSTPFDSLIAGTHGQWLDWLDQIIAANNNREDSKSLFGNFVTQHPGVEHFGGVARGGTFVLVYDTNKTVIADFMLPYYWAGPERIEPNQPLLPKPGWISGDLMNNGLKVISLTDNIISKIQPTIEQKLQNFDTVEKTVGMITAVYGTKTVAPSNPVQDPILSAGVSAAENYKNLIKNLTEKATDQTLSQPQRDQYAAQAVAAQNVLAQSIQNTIQYVSNTGMDVSTGTEGFNALMNVSTAMSSVTDANAANTLATGLNLIRSTATSGALKVLVGNMGNMVGRTFITRPMMRRAAKNKKG